MVDHTPTDETVLPAGGLPLPPSTISAELVRKLRLARAEVHTMPNSAARLYGDAADAIEALSADNARMRAIIGPQAHCQSCGSVVDMDGHRALACDCTDGGMPDKQRLGVWDREAREEVGRMKARAAAKSAADEAEGLRPHRDVYRMDWQALRDACREEPDDDTKRAVSEMMDKLNGRDGD